MYKVLFTVVLLCITSVAQAQMPLSRQFMISSVPDDPQCEKALLHAHESIQNNNLSGVELAAISFVDEGFCQVFNVASFSVGGVPGTARDHLMSLFRIWEDKKILHSFVPPAENSVVWILKEYPPEESES